MDKTGQPPRLSERLKAQMQADQEAVQGLTTKLLQEHASALREARAAALSTTQDVTARHLHQIEKMQRQHLQQLRRSLWVLWLVPLVILMLCGVTLAATWKAVEWKTETERISRANQIRLLDQQYCAQRPGNCQPQKQTQPPPSQNRK